MKRAAAVYLAVVCSILAACAPTKPAAQENDQEPLRAAVSLHSATGSCGVELWAIKTLTDAAAGTVNLAPSATSLSILRAATPPTFSYTRPRFAPIETQAWTVTATLTGYKLEADSDVHLVLQDSSGASMIAEIPDPACATGSRVLAQITAARQAFEADHNLANQCFACLKETVTLTGIGFFDALHGQTGVAPNGVELHPVIAYIPGGTPPPPPTTGASTTTAPPTTATVTTTSSTTSSTTTSTTPTTGDDTLDERPGCNLYPDRIYWNHVKQSHCQADYFTSP